MKKEETRKNIALFLLVSSIPALVPFEFLMILLPQYIDGSIILAFIISSICFTLSYVAFFFNPKRKLKSIVISLCAAIISILIFAFILKPSFFILV